MGKRMPPQIEQLIEETRSELEKVYADRLKAVILYGSYARGDYSQGSDVDLLLLLDDLRDVLAEREKFFPVVSRLSLKYDTVVSAIPMDRRTFDTQKPPLILNVKNEGRHL